MVHNGIEYGMMQALAEGFAVLKKSRYHLNLSLVARIYSQGSVIASRLVDWVRSGFKKHGEDLKEISSTVAHTGEGAWTVEAAKKLSVDVPIIAGSLAFRKKSSKIKTYTGKVLSMLRGEFGGHSTK
jgi:6-phosphogluconate dehydrogenase